MRVVINLYSKIMTIPELVKQNIKLAETVNKLAVQISNVQNDLQQLRRQLGVAAVEAESEERKCPEFIGTGYNAPAEAGIN